MSAADIATLVGMGATRSQAVRALATHKDVMEAANAVFENEDEGDRDGDEVEGEEEEGEDSYYGEHVVHQS